MTRRRGSGRRKRKPRAARGGESRQVPCSRVAVSGPKVEDRQAPVDGRPLRGGCVSSFQDLGEPGIHRAGRGVAIAVQKFGVGPDGRCIRGGAFRRLLEPRLRLRSLTSSLQAPSLVREALSREPLCHKAGRYKTQTAEN